MKNENNYCGFSFSINIANFEAWLEHFIERKAFIFEE